ncbi:MAG: hypothetical protein H8E31_13750 [Planctomycetes bacterium]|nr:hypothetical protein [Planctomycetota bacterium]
MGAAAAPLTPSVPARQTRRGMICCAIIGPARRLATVLNEPPASTARCLQARADQEDAA